MSAVSFKTLLSSAGVSLEGLGGQSLGIEKQLPDQQGAKKSKNFSELLKESLVEVNNQQAVADKMATNIAIGKSENIHETMLAISEAELSFKLMVQIRNKALEAYQEIMRMQV